MESMKDPAFKMLVVYQMGRLCGGAHEISGIHAPLILCGWVEGLWGGWVCGGWVLVGGALVRNGGGGVGGSGVWGGGHVGEGWGWWCVGWVGGF